MNGVEVVGTSRATGSPSIIEVDVDRCDDLDVLRKLVRSRAASLALLLADVEWPLRAEDDPAFRGEVLAEIHNVALVLARLTELLDAPPADLIERARNARAIRQADEALALAALNRARLEVVRA